MAKVVKKEGHRRGTKYDWPQWFRELPADQEFEAAPGRDFDCQPDSFRSLLHKACAAENAALKKAGARWRWKLSTPRILPGGKVRFRFDKVQKRRKRKSTEGTNGRNR